MRKVDKRPEILDRPTLSLEECRHLLGMEREKWRSLWKRVYIHRVEHLDTTNGIRIDVESLVAALFPKIAKDPLSMARMTIEVVMHMGRIRAERRLRTTEKRKKKAGE